MKKFTFKWFCDFREIKQVTVSYDLYTASGNNITSKSFEIAIDNPIYYDYDDYGFYTSKVNNFLENKHKKLLQSNSKTILKEQRKEQFRELKNGHIITGKYIVRCNYQINFVDERISFDRYNQLIKNKKAEEIKLDEN